MSTMGIQASNVQLKFEMFLKPCFFIFCVVTGSGMALYALSAHIIHYWRIRERVRNFYNGVSINYIGYLNDAATQFVKGFVYKYIYSTTLEIGNTENESSDVTFSTVTSKSCIKLFNTSILRTIPIGDDTCPSGATKQILCSPSSDRTSTIHAVLLSIPPKCTMNFEKARGLEVYFVLEGNGSIRVNTGTEEKTEKIIANDSFVINPFTKRCLFNQGWRCLRVIRITDGGNTYEDTNLDITSKIPSSLTRRKTIDTFIGNFVRICSY